MVFGLRWLDHCSRGWETFLPLSYIYRVTITLIELGTPLEILFKRCGPRILSSWKAADVTGLMNLWANSMCLAGNPQPTCKVGLSLHFLLAWWWCKLINYQSCVQQLAHEIFHGRGSFSIPDAVSLPSLTSAIHFTFISLSQICRSLERTLSLYIDRKGLLIRPNQLLDSLSFALLIAKGLYLPPSGHHLEQLVPQSYCRTCC